MVARHHRHAIALAHAAGGKKARSLPGSGAELRPAPRAAGVEQKGALGIAFCAALERPGQRVIVLRIETENFQRFLHLEWNIIARGHNLAHASATTSAIRTYFPPFSSERSAAYTTDSETLALSAVSSLARPVRTVSANISSSSRNMSLGRIFTISRLA